MLYDRPVSELMVEFAGALHQTFKPADAVTWFAAHYPMVKATTVRAYVIGLTANDSNRHHYQWLASKKPLFVKLANGELVRFDPIQHSAAVEALLGPSSALGRPSARRASTGRHAEVRHRPDEHDAHVGTAAPVTASSPPRCREPVDIEANLQAYLGDRNPTARYASFDYCYNYFQSYREQGDTAGIAASSNLQLSCLQLGFYLASWGMLRGSTDLFQRSIRHLVPLVKAIASAPAAMWEIDADSYSDDAWLTLRDFARAIRTALPDATSDILVTKIILGVFGSVPAFDTYFKKGSDLSTYGRPSLRRVERFYREHSSVIERHRVPTTDFETGTESHRTYTRAKVIDMIFFIEGMQLSARKT